MFPALSAKSRARRKLFLTAHVYNRYFLKYCFDMTVRMDSLVKAIAVALDMVEGELLGASANHGKRVAALCARMGRKPSRKA